MQVFEIKKFIEIKNGKPVNANARRQKPAVCGLNPYARSAFKCKFSGPS